ncbi:MAG: hypothetical protein K6G01_00095 [Eubacterium sp.]|nr:hypothetical protein [Eubacterium sp.]
MKIPFVKSATYQAQMNNIQNQKSNQQAEQPSTVSNSFREQLQALNRTTPNQNNYQGTSVYKQNGYLELSTATTTKKQETTKKATNYNYKEVATKILRAKTSISAGQAVIAAKRKVTQIRRKIASGDGDAEELQIALSHAKRMELVAKKKKRHLELEELVEHTQARDERMEEQEDAVQGIKSSVFDAVQEEIEKQQDAIFEEREAMIAEAAEEYPQEMLAEINEMIAEFGEEELKELEELSELFDQMEIVDPHMSEEDLEKLKKKHRASEQKAITKADMEYIKDMVNLMEERGGESMPGDMGVNIQM